MLGNINGTILKKLDIEVFVGNNEIQKDVWGEYLYVHLDETTIPNEIEAIRPIVDSALLVYPVSNGRIGYQLEINDEDKMTIIFPFLRGKYSEINRSYVKENFPEKELIGMDVFGRQQFRKLTNWKILNKDDSLREWWEEKLAVSLPDGAEVWSRPEKAQEIYKYYEEIYPEIAGVYIPENTGAEQGGSGDSQAGFQSGNTRELGL